MKSQDIVVLFKIESLTQHWVNPSQYDKELLVPRASSIDWLGEDLRHNDVPPATFTESLFSVRALEQDTGISKSQVSLSLKRMYDVGLAKPDRKTGLPKANTRALLEFIAYGIQYVFPAKEGEVTRGIATSIAAPVLQGKLMTSGELAPIWPYYKGKTKGVAVQPLHENIFAAIRTDDLTYALLALTDAVRIGHSRERGIAIEMMRKLLRVSS
ncbi:hypothetical protein [Aliidiomarina sanyensis]|uniref:Uncharacterized protein n=1 Tax=Aliidiomarina sanyensis TaxID=1249555 RepID=A0A432WGG5_9GAMM|nr:hypothetical protein [Aliidiomarina sanyensis]RUO32843.1 hypothetical protein CWE11_07380 [Aliidiomarina sanyensis]